MRHSFRYIAAWCIFAFCAAIVFIPAAVSATKAIPACCTYTLKWHWLWTYPNKKDVQNHAIKLDKPLNKTDRMVASISYNRGRTRYAFKFQWDPPPKHLFMIKGKPMWYSIPMQIMRRGAQGDGANMTIGSGGDGIDYKYRKVVNALQQNFGGNRNFRTETISDSQAYVNVMDREGQKAGYSRFHIVDKCNFDRGAVRYAYFTVRFEAGGGQGVVYYVYELTK